MGGELGLTLVCMTVGDFHFTPKIQFSFYHSPELYHSLLSGAIFHALSGGDSHALSGAIFLSSPATVAPLISHNSRTRAAPIFTRRVHSRCSSPHPTHLHCSAAPLRRTYTAPTHLTAPPAFSPSHFFSRQQAVIKESVEPLLEEYRPTGISSLKFSKLSLGTVAPNIEGIRVQSLKEGQITMDIDLRWGGDLSIILAVEAARVAFIPIQLKDLKVFTVVRAIFQLADEIPCISPVVVALLAEPKPRIDYTLKAVGGSLTAIPGLSDMIDMSSDIFPWFNEYSRLVVEINGKCFIPTILNVRKAIQTMQIMRDGMFLRVWSIMFVVLLFVGYLLGIQIPM
ncbi:Calcium-dependent lipid-binding (CaLB domain) family protein [Striga hermonthica]|uniref:Calcium-dependent lipid-binding (CaLB domain) family protein n=1 Tax=Striga hermonthica TaxID=68872 RepID=A0A9N7R3K2_STRHE|nr:Calcium-dependent lipid-binding (CaLB domain) family protein [Striga hermonthica]